MPNAPATPLASGDHVVQFYDRDDELIDIAGACLAAAALAGDAVIIVARPARRRALVEAMEDAGVDAGAAEAEGRLVVLDAADTLAQFRIGGALDRTTFDAFAGHLIRTAAGTTRRVHACGEMVALLWEAGEVVQALELETWWDDLTARLPVSVFCGYPSGIVRAAIHAGDYDAVCRLHSGVIGGAPAEPDAEAIRRFPPAVWAPRMARQFVADTLHAWDLDAIAADTQLVATELATNAIRHARSEFTVSLARRRGGVRVAVGDASLAPPVLQTPAPTDTRGRGLHLVDRIAAGWRSTTVAGGKLVEADLTARDPIPR